jgi:uncharacterized membrane protein HdeD (DUF308 family)
LRKFILNRQKMEKKEMNLVERLAAPTSKFFQTVRNIGLCLAAAGGAIVAAPVTLPVIVTTAAGYLIAIGGVMTAVAQATVENE